MSIWSLIVANQDLLLGIAASVAGAIGLQRKKQKERESTTAEVDRWANAVAGGIVLAIRGGLFSHDEEAMLSALAKFRALATAAGVNLKPEHEARAVAMMHNALVAAGQDMVMDQAAKLKRVVDQAFGVLPMPAVKK